MCGIFFCLYYSHESEQCNHSTLNERGTIEANSGEDVESLLIDPILGHRGPNVSKRHSVSFDSECLCGWMQGCVLHLRGNLTPQPVTDDRGNALLWNGEIFGGIDVPKDENDTQVLFQRLRSCQSDEAVLKTLELVQGPWAFIFWQAERKRLWFGRDIFGRRSLLWHLPSSPSELLVLTSVAVGNLNYSEVPSVGIFAIDLSSGIDGVGLEQPSLCRPSSPTITLYPWNECRWPGTSQTVLQTQPQEISSFLTPNQPLSCLSISVDRKHILKRWIPNICKTISSQSDSSNQEKSSTDDDYLVKCLGSIFEENESQRLLSEELISVLLKAVEKRINNLPVEQAVAKKSDDQNASQAKIAVLFSGGLDSSVIAALLDRCLPPEEPIDLLNVAFEQPSPAAKPKQKEKRYRPPKNKRHKEKTKDSNPNVESTLMSANDTSTNENENCMAQSAIPQSIPPDIVEASLYENSALNHSKANNNDEDPLNSIPESISVDRFTTMCNVVQESATSLCQPGTMTHDPSTTYDPYDVPDRRTGRIALSELNPRRQWNFIEIDVSKEELHTARSSCVGRLIYPLHTVLDDSIGCAVWFAARGRGRLANQGGQTVVSTAKVVLCGMAADELFAGYSRHRAHFNQWGEESLINQLEQEIWRISARNLGRDDRVIADHGKEARFPFLDETFTDFISRIPVHVRANLYLPRGVGEKLLLRLSAWSLGLRQTACQPKRAIQFGSKIAKLDDHKEKGSDICHRLL